MGISDTVGFHGECVSELRAAFQEAVDDYLATLETLGQRYFATERWQAGERAADADLAAGRFEDFDNMDDFLKSLDEARED